MWRVLKWILLLLLLLVVAAGLALAVYLFDWPLVPILVGVGAAVALCVLGVLGVRWWRRRKRRRAAQEENRARGRHGAAVRQLQDSWKRFQAQLKAARGGRVDLEAAPWVLLLGEPGAGKTAAAAASGEALDAAAATDDGFGWFLFPEVVVLDPPGRYVTQGSEADRAEWEELLDSIRRARKAAPLDAVLVCVPALELVAEGGKRVEGLTEDVGRRLEELVGRLGYRIPVQLLVTGLDRIEGAVRFFDALPEEARQQALGASNLGANEDPETFVADVMERLHGRLCELRLEILGDSQPAQVAPHSLLFPEEFRQLAAPLTRLVGGVLGRAALRERPPLAGLYFASARSEGIPRSAYLPALGLRDEQVALPAQERPLFLADLFREVLPQAKGRAVRTTRAAGQQRLTERIAVGVWVAACLALAAMFSASFVRTLDTIQEAREAVPPNLYLEDSFSAALQLVDDLRGAVTRVKKRNAAAWIPSLGLNQAAVLEQRLVDSYVAKFRNGVLRPVDAAFARSLAALGQRSDPTAVARHVDFLTRRIQLLTRVLQERPALGAIASAPLPDFELALAAAEFEVGAGAAARVQESYLACLAWTEDRRLLEEELAAQKQVLQELLASPAIGFAWLRDWVNLQPDLEPVLAERFWEGRVTGPDGKPLGVEAAYTPAGWLAMRGFLDEIGAAFQQEEAFAGGRRQYQEQYAVAYYEAWRGFLEAFSRGAEGWQGRERRLELARLLAGRNSPYRRVSAAAVENLEPAVELSAEEEAVPAWMELLFRWEKLNDPAYQRSLKGAEGAIGKLAARSTRALGRLKASLRGTVDRDAVASEDAKTLPFVTAYAETLDSMAGYAQSPQAAQQLTQATFEEAAVGVGEPKSAVRRNFWSQEELKDLMSFRQPREEAFWDLLEEPTQLIWGILVDETQVHLQRVWEEEVLAEAKGLGGWERLELLKGPSGKVWAYQDRYADPYLEGGRDSGVAPRRLHGRSLEFSQPFLDLLRMGKLGGNAVSKTYTVRVSALPTGANAGARVQPHETRLILECQSGVQELVNRNYPISKNLQWTAGDCADVVVEISVGELILKHRYRGHDGFVQFLRDFRDGTRRFGRDAFGEHSGRLSGYGVDEISVSYSISNEGPVLNLARYQDVDVPRRVFR